MEKHNNLLEEGFDDDCTIIFDNKKDIPYHGKIEFHPNDYFSPIHIKIDISENFTNENITFAKGFIKEKKCYYLIPITNNNIRWNPRDKNIHLYLSEIFISMDEINGMDFHKVSFKQKRLNTFFNIEQDLNKEIRIDEESVIINIQPNSSDDFSVSFSTNKKKLNYSKLIGYINIFQDMISFLSSYKCRCYNLLFDNTSYYSHRFKEKSSNDVYFVKKSPLFCYTSIQDLFDRIISNWFQNYYKIEEPYYYLIKDINNKHSWRLISAIFSLEMLYCKLFPDDLFYLNKSSYNKLFRYLRKKINADSELQNILELYKDNPEIESQKIEQMINIICEYLAYANQITFETKFKKMFNTNDDKLYDFLSCDEFHYFYSFKVTNRDDICNIIIKHIKYFRNDFCHPDKEIPCNNKIIEAEPDSLLEIIFKIFYYYVFECVLDLKDTSIIKILIERYSNLNTVPLFYLQHY